MTKAFHGFLPRLGCGGVVAKVLCSVVSFLSLDHNKNQNF